MRSFIFKRVDRVALTLNLIRMCAAFIPLFHSFNWQLRQASTCGRSTVYRQPHWVRFTIRLAYSSTASGVHVSISKLSLRFGLGVRAIQRLYDRNLSYLAQYKTMSAMFSFHQFYLAWMMDCLC